MTGSGAENLAAMLAQFHRAFGESYGGKSVRDSAGRRKLHDDEHRELLDALDAGDLVGVARELADIVYVAFGTAHSLGIPLAAVLTEVHRANLAKIGPGGQVTLDDAGKVCKPHGWTPPNVAGVLDRFGVDWRSGHTLLVCATPCPTRQADRSCMFCDGGLSACINCGAFEGCWPDECPPEPMTDEQHDAVYAGRLNYRDGAWRDGECCQVMRHIHDREAFMAEHGYRLAESGRWERIES